MRLLCPKTVLVAADIESLRPAEERGTPRHRASGSTAVVLYQARLPSNLTPSSLLLQNHHHMLPMYPKSAQEERTQKVPRIRSAGGGSVGRCRFPNRPFPTATAVGNRFDGSRARAHHLTPLFRSGYVARSNDGGGSGHSSDSFPEPFLLEPRRFPPVGGSVGVFFSPSAGPLM